jgi:glutathione synthase/RimK-type ligase-like ATP-grasp enzyme
VVDTQQSSATILNVLAAPIEKAALEQALNSQGKTFTEAMSETHRHLFADVPLYITATQLAQMQAVIAAVEEVQSLPPPRGKDRMGVVQSDSRISTPTLTLPGETTSQSTKPASWQVAGYLQGGGDAETSAAHGVCYGYDFHLNKEGAHLIEINTNAGGLFLNALLLDSQRHSNLPGKAAADDNLHSVLLAMFRKEWQLARGDAPLRHIAIVDEQPQSQYLYPEFILAQALFERAGIAAHIVAPEQLQARDDGLYVVENKIDLLYNRLTDFTLQAHQHLLRANQQDRVVLTPDPAHYQRYADKRNLVALSDADALRAAGVSPASIAALAQGLPQTQLVNGADAERWWAERKQWFFKPVSGYGSKGAYRGDKMTKRVFEEVMQSDYVAQRLAAPGERMVLGADDEPQPLKYDVRCYVYEGHIQLVAARLYQGQTTNFRTPGGGFAMVRVLG